MDQFQSRQSPPSKGPIGAGQQSFPDVARPWQMPPRPPEPPKALPQKWGNHDDDDDEPIRTVREVRHSDKVFIEPAPLWDGKEPEKHWKRKRRDIMQWRHDQLAPSAMLGTRLFRATSGDARTIAERVTDEELRKDNVVETLLATFDGIYQAFMTIEDDKAFDSVFYHEIRTANEPMLPWMSRNVDCFLKYEAQGGVLPMHTKGKLMLRHANLGPHQEAKVLTWLEGKRDLDTVISKLKQLDVENLQWQANRKGAGTHFNEPEAQNYPVMASYGQEDWPNSHVYPAYPSAAVTLPESAECFLCDEETPQAVSSQGDWEVMLYQEDPLDQNFYDDEALGEGICSQDEGYFWLSGAKMQKTWTEP
jgi:hypothetical protein